MDNIQSVFITASQNYASSGTFQLQFDLSEQQNYASNEILAAIKAFRSKILYAVTGAGKTEMIFEAIQYARSQGYNVAIVSPRVDVVIEVSMRIAKAFQQEAIDVLYQGHGQKYNGHFIVATIHQLYRFKRHFNLIIVDEVDAFPLDIDPSLFEAVKHASNKHCSHIYMTATPSKKLRQRLNDIDVIVLPARFHRHSLPIPLFKYFNLKPRKIQRKLLNILRKQITNQRLTLVFFNNIQLMKEAYNQYKTRFTTITYVHSDDVYRFEKVKDLRNGKYQIVFTTTILERGFTMANLDVIVCNSHNFSTNALIQIAGRVGRKREDPSGLVLFLHEGITFKMLQARKNIKRMNQLAREKGWIDD
ncbi:DEAD/DEAH box helicase family protein [Staphylococcus pseudoxylosus]|uniref:DEAD/DEAH box helicase family protein n=1 Tax=Staphylococcus pseudoxylosus TaxID=2282419 RepID=UPI00398B671D